MDIAIRSFVAFLFVFAVTRVVGRRELSSLEPFDVIMLVVIGDLVQQGVTQSDYSITGILIVLSVVTLMTALFAYLNFRFPRIRPFMEGRPVVLIDNGSVIERNLRRERLTVGEVEAEARQQQIASLGKVRWAVLERNGRISFIPDDEEDASIFDQAVL
ncbi:MAG TPA: YetF domain-containing protein [Solirubrobacterales bacterium]|nr:YetF domain-containing protein [Solirubrobacterales bacterium]